VFTPAPYSLEFRREAVELLKRSGKSAPELARELGVSPQSLRNWARQIDVDEGKAAGLISDERVELRRLRRENRILVEEREIFKKRRRKIAAARPLARGQPEAGSGPKFCVRLRVEPSRRWRTPS
jgi:transposase